MRSIDTSRGNPAQADEIGCGCGIVRLYRRRGRWARDKPVRQIRTVPRRSAPHERPEDLSAKAPVVPAEAWVLLLDAAERLARKAAEIAPGFDRRWAPLATMV